MNTRRPNGNEADEVRDGELPRPSRLVPGSTDQYVGGSMTTTERGLWLLVGACGVHVIEEYALDWRSWAQGLSGLQVTWGRFWLTNAAFLCLAFVAAMVGFRRPAIGLALPSLTLINGLFFHIGPTIALRRVSPGVFSSAVLYVPISIWLFWRMHKQGRLTRGVVLKAVALGAAIMAIPFVLFSVG
jgi:hypothetical protein